MKLPDYNSPENFVTWLARQEIGEVPTKEQWEEIKKRLNKAVEWVHPWHLKPSGGDDDGGGGEDLVPPHFKDWPFPTGNLNRIH
jgi:hypothetical protein